MAEHPRVVIPKLLSLEECKELEFIHKCSSAVGYRGNVLSTTLSHLIATNSAHLLMPFVPIRERLKEKVEQHFGCEYELFVEFTGLISWCKGASIGWHSDDNRPYLKQRDFSAVCYLNNYGDDFDGGLFHFQDGEPQTIVPSCGDAVIYTADTRNNHSVDEVTSGERLTLALWFSRDNSHDEDAKLISLLSESLLHSRGIDPWLPRPASSSMYWFSPGQDTDGQFGFDICWGRIKELGFEVCYSHEKCCDSDVSELLMEPVRLVKGNELLDVEFSNILHALQVVQYYRWKASDSNGNIFKAESSRAVLLSDSQKQRIGIVRSLFAKDCRLASTILSRPVSGESKHRPFDWMGFSAAISSWEVYVRTSFEGMRKSLPLWRSQQAIYNVPFHDKSPVSLSKRS